MTKVFQTLIGRHGLPLDRLNGFGCWIVSVPVVAEDYGGVSDFRDLCMNE
jgi:hypothetical protein